MNCAMFGGLNTTRRRLAFSFCSSLLLLYPAPATTVMSRSEQYARAPANFRRQIFRIASTQSYKDPVALLANLSFFHSLA